METKKFPFTYLLFTFKIAIIDLIIYSTKENVREEHHERK